MAQFLVNHPKVSYTIIDHLLIEIRFNCSVSRNSQSATLNAHKSGVHVNFEPVLAAAFGAASQGAPVQVSVHYYARMKVASGIAVGILTGGISAIGIFSI